MFHEVNKCFDHATGLKGSSRRPYHLGEDDQIISNKLAVRLHCELPDAVIRQIPGCGHLPHVEKPNSAAKLILDFVGEDSNKEAQSVSQV
uniref:AB hydrolase-1 domain-containing protein n=1 Tax=Salix viminalis TaxID=40686 RepID=A0A6N2L156_SALVM